MATPTPAPEATTAEQHSAGEHVGERIGHYKLLQLIAEGGFGSVYMAEQDQPVHRRVALKIIKPGMDSRMVAARFEAERQALALMDHPHIARVFDGGVTDPTMGARPYFVMEYVKGDPITSFADAHRLSIEERLVLFTQVCEAVQHAHTKGIIHRDIKPGNVLVNMTDGRPFARVIDFGIAKATGARLTDRTLFTEHSQLIGTPEYMSPEQAEGSPDIDTRADIYALGVLLYELLTGSTPFETSRLRSAAFVEMQRIIREEDPPSPSLRLSRNLASLAAAASARRSEPARLGALIKGELDWIVMKALDKDRSRRYETPGQLAEDVRQHLSGGTVRAAPPSPGYRLRKFVRRRRAPLITAGLVGMALVLGLIGTSIGLIRARSTLQKLAAEQTLRERLNQLDGLVAEAQYRRGAVEACDPARRAAEGFSEAVGPGDRRTLAAWTLYANCLSSADRKEEARAVYARCLEDRRRYLGPGDVWTIGLVAEMVRCLDSAGAPGGLELYREAAAQALAHLPPGDETRDAALRGYADRLRSANDLTTARTVYGHLRESLAKRSPAPQEAIEAVDRIMAELDSELSRSSKPD